MRRTIHQSMHHHGGASLVRGALLVALAACSSPAPTPSPTPVPVTLSDASTGDNVDAYRAAGFLVGAGSIPFVGIVRFAATEYLDSTAVLIAVSLPPRSLSFVRAGDRYVAYYGMRIDLMRGEAIVRSERPVGEIRVASFAETTRGDEGIIFQRTLRASPGAYLVRIQANDSLGTGSGSITGAITVPSMGDGSVASMIPVFASEPRQTRSAPLTVVANPRATVRYGRDSVLDLYIEAYGPTAPDRVSIEARRSATPAMASHSDTVTVPTGTAVRASRSSIPVFKLGLGPIQLVTRAPDGRRLDSLTAHVTLGLDIPVASISELIEALRYFASETDLQRLRSASDAARPALWAALVRRTDPNTSTPDNEALLEYARRLRVADRLYAEPASRGWQTARGAVIAAIGEPDVMTAPVAVDSMASMRVISWEYRRHRLSLSFWDAAGPGQWRLTPLSDGDLKALIALAGPCVGCR